MSKTIKQLLLANKKIARLDAELLLAYVIKKPREFVLTYPNQKITTWQNVKYQRLIKKRENYKSHSKSYVWSLFYRFNENVK